MTVDRRRILHSALAGSTLGALLPEKWVKPVVKSVIVPAHAAGSPSPSTSAAGTTAAASSTAS